MRTAALLALLLAWSTCNAAAPAPRMTGERLVKLLQPMEAADVVPAPGGKFSREELAILQTMRNIEFVQGYLAALYDETEGSKWCYNASAKAPKPDTLFDESRWGLHRLPPDQLKQNAAQLLVAIWREKWPCRANAVQRSK